MHLLDKNLLSIFYMHQSVKKLSLTAYTAYTIRNFPFIINLLIVIATCNSKKLTNLAKKIYINDVKYSCHNDKFTFTFTIF